MREKFCIVIYHHYNLKDNKWKGEWFAGIAFYISLDKASEIRLTGTPFLPAIQGHLCAAISTRSTTVDHNSSARKHIPGRDYFVARVTSVVGTEDFSMSYHSLGILSVHLRCREHKVVGTASTSGVKAQGSGNEKQP
jgi:hypothetical protein